VPISLAMSYTEKARGKPLSMNTPPKLPGLMLYYPRRSQSPHEASRVLRLRAKSECGATSRGKDYRRPSCPEMRPRWPFG